MHRTTSRQARSTARVYRALARAFHQPAADLYHPAFLETLRRSLDAAGASGLLPLVEEMAEGLRDLPDLTDLTVEYCRLFYGPGKVAAPPYESVYLGGGLLMGEPAIQVLRCYEEAGVRIGDGFRDMPDHIGAELEYLCLAARETGNFAALRRHGTVGLWAARYRSFLTEHLAPWVRPFATKVHEGSDSRFYRALVTLTTRWVERERTGAESLTA